MGFSFRILKRDYKTNARLCLLQTPHGSIQTPAFVPVATKGALRGLTFDQAQDFGAEIFMINTFHFYLRKTYKTVQRFGGLHRFLNLSKPLMTDSGGFQVFSLGFGSEHGVGKIANIFPSERKNSKQATAQKNQFKTGSNLVKIDGDGVTFKSPLDGQKLRLTPALSIKIQQALGADFIFAFDECTSPLSSYEYTRLALARTHRWAEECLRVFYGSKKSVNNQMIFGIVQGGEYRDLREESAKFISSLPFFGFGIGGSLGKSKEDMHRVLEWVMPFLLQNKPRHLLGIGEVDDIFEAVKRGIDLFDCVIPTRLARHGAVLTLGGNLNLKSSKHLNSKESIEKNCFCFVCKNFSRAYLHHLIKNQEILGIYYLSYHNLYFILTLMKLIRKAIKSEKLEQVEKLFYRKQLKIKV
jgi:queuine tRNA-ribosyltransferase/7-cyano-7-deazaguanine tRNA-ribosyltransferase